MLLMFSGLCSVLILHGFFFYKYSYFLWVQWIEVGVRFWSVNYNCKCLKFFHLWYFNKTWYFMFWNKECAKWMLAIQGIKLPVRYLGTCSSDCNPLIEKFTARINSWLSKNLYFSSIFILLKKVIRSIKQKFYRFLWSGNDSSAASLLEKKWLEMWFVYLKRREL